MDSELLQQEIQDLKRQLAERDSTIKSNQKAADHRALQIHKKYEIREMLRGMKTTYDELPQDAREAAVQAILDIELRGRDAELFMDDNGNIKLQNTDGTSFLAENHQQLNPGSFLEKILTDHKILVGKNDPDEINQQQAAPAKYSHLRDLVKGSQEAFAAGVTFNPLHG